MIEVYFILKRRDESQEVPSLEETMKNAIKVVSASLDLLLLRKYGIYGRDIIVSSSYDKGVVEICLDTSKLDDSHVDGVFERLDARFDKDFRVMEQWCPLERNEDKPYKPSNTDSISMKTKVFPNI